MDLCDHRHRPTRGAYDKDDIFIAVPRFGLDDALWYGDTSTRADPLAPYTTTLKNDTNRTTYAAEIHPSLPLSKLKRAGADSLQLIEPATLWVFQGDHEDFEHRDWTPALQTRIAEAIDCPGRTMVVVGPTIIDELQEEAAPSDLDALRRRRRSPR